MQDNIMGTISERKQKDGTIRYRAEIRINKDGTKFSESKTFSNKALAKNWLKKRELELELDPQLLQKKHNKSMLFCDVVKKYVDNVGGNFGRSWKSSLATIAKMPIGQIPINKMSALNFSDFASSRLNGAYKGFKPISPATLKGDMIAIRGVLNYAETILSLDVPITEFEKVVRSLTKTRQITSSGKRNRLPTNEELIILTKYFFDKFNRRATALPMHLVMWFAIYTARRQDEFARLRLSDLQGDWWLLRDIKHPNGSAGNDKHFFVNENAKSLLPLFLDEKLRQNQRKMVKNFDNGLLLPVCGKTISHRFTESCKVLGIEDLHFHDLRHEACTRLAENGATIPQIQQTSLHDSWSSLQRYVNIRPRPKVLDYWDIIKDD